MKTVKRSNRWRIKGYSFLCVSTSNHVPTRHFLRVSFCERNKNQFCHWHKLNMRRFWLWHKAQSCHSKLINLWKDHVVRCTRATSLSYNTITTITHLLNLSSSIFSRMEWMFMVIHDNNYNYPINYNCDIW